MRVLFICMLISCYCFCGNTDDENASFKNALYVFQHASSDMVVLRLKVIDTMFKTKGHIPADINVINEATGHCLLRCALKHHRVRFFESACQEKSAEMDPQFLYWLIETQPRHLIEQALDTTEFTNDLKQNAFAAARSRPHIIDLLNSYIGHEQDRSVVK